MSEALYRKYRPQTFADVVGQEHIERTIRNAIEQDKVSHAYLFCGPRGTGKTTTARLLAKALLCEHGPTPDPDGTCQDCREIAAGTHPDVYELDAASRTGVENVREEIIGRVQFAPTRGRKKVYIIDEVHMLSTAAFNALLKTLEEPPEHVVFILCTTDPQKVPETIHSRCQRFDFRRIGTDSIVSRLGAVCVAEGVEFEGEALELIAHRAEGGMRNALTALEQVIAFGEGSVTLRGAEDMLGSLDTEDLAEIVDAIGVRDVAACFTWTARYIETGADLAQFARDLAEHFRNMYVLSMAGADVALDVSEAERRELVREMGNYGPDRLANLLGVLGDVLAELRTSTNPRLTFEIGLTRMVRPDSDLTLASLAERVEALEAGKSAVAYGTATGDAGARQTPVPAATEGQRAVAPAVRSAAVGGGVPAAAERSVGVGAPAAAEPASGDAGVGMPSATAAHREPVGGPAAPASAAKTAAVAAVGGVPAAPNAARTAGQRTSADRPTASAAAASAASAGVATPAAQAAPRPAAQAAATNPAGKAVAAQPAAPSASAGAPAASGTAGSGRRFGETAPGLADKLQNPAALQRIWQAAISAARRTNPMLGTVYLNTDVGCDGAGEGVLVTFPRRNAFAYTAASKPDAVEAMLGFLQQAAGAPVALRLAMPGENAPAATGAAASAAPVARPAAPSAPPARQAVPRPASQPVPSSSAAAPASAAPSTAGGSSAAVPSAPIPPSPAAMGSAPFQTSSVPPASVPAHAAGPSHPAPAVPRLRESRASADGGVRAVAPRPDEEAAPAPVAPSTPAGADNAGESPDMPRLAPKRKKPLPIPGKGVPVPTYVREGIRPEGARSSADAASEPAAPSEGPVPAGTQIPGSSAPVAGGVASSSGASEDASDDYDRVPLDAYEGMAYSEEDVVLPWEDGPSGAPEPAAPAFGASPSAAVPASVFDPASTAAPSPAAVPAVPATSAPGSAPALASGPFAAPHPAVPSSPAPNPAVPSAAAPAQTPPAGPEPTADELNAFLASGFGDGVVFQEVRE